MFSKEKLKMYREGHNLSQSKLSKQLNITRAAYSNWEKGKTQPNRKNLALLAQILDISIEDFESETPIVSSYLRLSSENQYHLERFADKLLVVQNLKQKIYTIKILEEQFYQPQDKTIIKTYQNIDVMSNEPFQYDLAIQMKDSSMEPVYPKGTVLLISNKPVVNGSAYALSYNNELFVRRVFQETNHYRFVALNHSFPEIIIPSSEEPQILGKVTQSLSPLSA